MMDRWLQLPRILEINGNKFGAVKNETVVRDGCVIDLNNFERNVRGRGWLGWIASRCRFHFCLCILLTPNISEVFFLKETF